MSASTQGTLWPETVQATLPLGRNADRMANEVRPGDAPVHRWYRFVLAFPPHLVRECVERFGLGGSSLLLDPFCGTGTTLVEAKKLGVPSVGIEAVPYSQFAAATKVSWDVDPVGLAKRARSVAEQTLDTLASQGIGDDFGEGPLSDSVMLTLPSSAAKLLVKDSISPLPLHKSLTLLNAIEEQQDGRRMAHERLALAAALVGSIGNLRFGPEVGVGKIKSNAPVVAPWLGRVEQMASDLGTVRARRAVKSSVLLGDARQVEELLEPQSVDAVITSPPYPNEKEYTRTVRLESVILGYMADRDELRSTKQRLVRSNTRGVYKADSDDEWVSAQPDVQRIAREIEDRRISRGKTSGFERTYHRVAKLYFGGMRRHLESLSVVLKPGARLAYVVGDQASYLRVMIRTGRLLADIALECGYEVEGIELFRTRAATATRDRLREEVVLLRWPGWRHA